MVNIVKCFRLSCRAVCAERIKQELEDMEVSCRSPNYFEGHYGIIWAHLECSCSEKVFDEMLKKLEDDAEPITIRI